MKAKEGELQHFDWRLLQLEDFGSGFHRSCDLAITDFLVKKEVTTMALLFQLEKPILDHSNGVLLLSSEETETSAKGTKEISPETVKNDQFPLAMVETGSFSSQILAVKKPALSPPFPG